MISGIIQFKAKPGNKGLVEIWLGDTSDSSCGENRAEWTRIGITTIKQMGQAVIDLSENKTYRIYF